MTTALLTHPACLLHDNGPGHIESPARLRAVLDALDQPAFQALKRHDAPRASLEQIERVHDRAYIDDILARVPESGHVMLDDETSLCPASGEAALRAAGALIAAVDQVMGGGSGNAFCAVRPPGHHAAVPPASGFCLFNNIAIGAAHAMEQHGLKRVAIVDFDVHHGNGTQDWAEAQDGILFISSHQFPLWPGSGRAQDTGPKNNIVNLPLPPGAGGAVFRETMAGKALPVLDAFGPELVMISAGFDAHASDPLGGLKLAEADFVWITAALGRLAQRHCRGRIVSALEGGYDIAALAQSAAAHVAALMDVGKAG